MARLQVLYLPSESVGDVVVRPRFALIIDQSPIVDRPDDLAAQLLDFADRIGAVDVFLTPMTLDLAQGGDDDGDADTVGVVTWDHREMARDIAENLRERLEAGSRVIPRGAV